MPGGIIRFKIRIVNWDNEMLYSNPRIAVCFFFFFFCNFFLPRFAGMLGNFHKIFHKTTKFAVQGHNQHIVKEHR